MKLRRAMAVAAATAVIAPVALLAAPAASAVAADDTVSNSANSAANDAPESTDPSASPEPTDEPAPEETDPETGETSEPGETPGAPDPGETEGEPTEPPSGEPTDGTTEKPTDGPSEEPTKDPEPSPEPTECETDDEGVDQGSALDLSVNGLPGKIVAGSGWHPFQLTASNTSDKALGSVSWLAAVDNDAVEEDDWLSNYAQLEYRDPETGDWNSIAGDVGNGFYFGETTLGPKKTVDIELRVNITAKAPAGGGYAIGIGGYLDEEENCTHSSVAYYEFTVLAPGSGNENPGEATPGKGEGKKPLPAPRPQGGAKELPATGALAETGAGSMLPTLGLIGGVTVLAGAGVVFAVRRRSGTDATA